MLTEETVQKAISHRAKINYLWETTQAILAIALTTATIYTSIRIMPSADTTGNVSFAPVPDTLKNALFVVIGFYFGRTNHNRTNTRRADDEQRR